MPSRTAVRELTSQEITLFCETLESIRIAGAPLDYGLMQSAPHLPRQLARLTEDIVLQISRGASMEQALASQSTSWPPIIQLVLTHGLNHPESGSLLKEIASTNRHLDDLRNSVKRGLVYPLILLMIAMVLGIYFARVTLPTLGNLYDSLRVAPPWFTGLLISLGARLGATWLLVSAAIASAVLLYLFMTALQNSDRHWDRTSLIPGLGSILRNVRAARLAQSLSLLVNHGVPLPRALQAVAASGLPQGHQTALLDMAARLEAGQPLDRTAVRNPAFPPLMQWLMVVGQQDSRLGATLRESAEYYRTRAGAQAEWLSRLLPVTLALGLGAGVTLIYGLCLFGPLAELLRSLGLP